MKMKLSVIIAIAQMSLGILMKGANNLYNSDMLGFVGEFIPQIILMLALFGWMDLLIILKWLTPWEQGVHDTTSEAPSIISQMISMFLNFGSIPEGQVALMDSQVFYSNFLLFISFVCVPWMLLLKPLALK